MREPYRVLLHSQAVRRLRSVSVANFPRARSKRIYIYIRSLRSLLKGKLLSKNLLPLVERILRRLKLPAVPGRSVMPGRSPQQSPRKCPNAVCVPRHKRINQRAQNLVMLRCFKTCPLTSVESNADPCKQPGG